MHQSQISPQLSSHGADGRQPVPGDSDGARPRENVLPALPDAVRDQTSALSGHYSQGRRGLTLSFVRCVTCYECPRFSRRRTSNPAT